MGRKRVARVLAATVLAVVVLAGCENPLNGVIKADKARAEAVTVTANPPTGSTLGPSQPVSLVFSHSMQISTLAVAGDLATTNVAWSRTTLANDTATLSPPSSFWPAGASLSLIIDAKSLSGSSLKTLTLRYTVSNLPTILASLKPAGSAFTAHETLVVTFTDSMDTSSVVITGDLSGGSPAWSSVAKPDDTLTISPPSGLWPTGAAKTFTVNGRNTQGFPLTQLSVTRAVFRGVCVSTAVNGGNDGNAGTAENPKLTIASAIMYAGANYLAAPGNTAEVRVSKGVYIVSSPGIQMQEGIVLEGGYDPNDWGSRSIATQETSIEDGSTSGGVSMTSPNRPVTFPSTVITNNTVIDGFTIIPGTGAYNAGIFSDTASPTIRNLKIVGRSGPSTTTMELYGIVLNGGNPLVTANSIFAAWEGSNMPVYAYGIYTITDLTPGRHSTIQNNTLISANRATTTVTGIFCGGVDDVIDGNTIAAGSGPSVSIGIKCDTSSPTITNNTIDAGSNVNSAQVRGISVSGSGVPANPSIDANVFSCSGGAGYDTYAIREENSWAEPTTVSNNHFATFFGSGSTIGFYYDEGTTKIQNLTTTITLQATSGTLASFGNTSP